MKAVIDNLSSATGWTNGGTGTITAAVNQVPNYIAGLGNTASLIIHVPGGNLGNSIAKPVTFDLTNYSEVTLHVWSRNFANYGGNYVSAADFAYKIEFGDGKVYYLPTFSGFQDVTLFIRGTGAITTVKITAVHNSEDYLIISYLVASADEIPVDLFQGIKEQLAAEMLLKYGSYRGGVTNKGILLGTLTAAAGASSFYDVNSFALLERYAVIFVDDGANSETHQIKGTDGQDFSFSGLYDGETFLHAHTGATFYLICPVEYGSAEREIILPGVAIWGMDADELLRTNKIEESRDTFTDGSTVQSRLTPVTFQYIIILDCEARTNALIGLMSIACRSLIGKQEFWCNGKKLNIFYEGGGQYIEPAEGFNEIPKIQYKCRVEVKEDIYDRLEQGATVSETLTVTPVDHLLTNNQ